MGLFNKKSDPLTDRARALNDQIAALEDQIQQLARAQARAQDSARAHPRLRSTTRPHGQTVAAAPPASEPIFEDVDHDRLTDAEEPEETPEHYNELGVRKYDLAGAWHRWKSQFRGPAAANPRLVNYLAAGSIQGLRPLRYEKRVARNRFLLLVVILVLVLWGLFAAFIRK